MGNRSYRGTFLVAWLAALCTVAPACADEPGGNAREDQMKQQLDQFNERIEAKRRDAKARCEAGDQKACSDAVCMRLLTEGPTAERYRDCSRSQGFKTTDLWAQLSPLRTSNRTQLSIHIVCLKKTDVMRLGGKEMKIFRQVDLEADTSHATASHDRNRFYTNMLGGPDFATWEEGADELCNPGKRAP